MSPVIGVLSICACYWILGCLCSKCSEQGLQRLRDEPQSRHTGGTGAQLFLLCPSGIPGTARVSTCLVLGVQGCEPCSGVNSVAV